MLLCQIMKVKTNIKMTKKRVEMKMMMNPQRCLPLMINKINKTKPKTTLNQ